MANAPRRGGWMETRLRPHQLATAQALTSSSRHYRMSTGQGQSFSGAAVCNIPLTAVVFVSPPRGQTRKCNHVVGGAGERSPTLIHLHLLSVLLRSRHIRVFIFPSVDPPPVTPSLMPRRRRIAAPTVDIFNASNGTFVAAGILKHLLSAPNPGWTVALAADSFVCLLTSFPSTWS